MTLDNDVRFAAVYHRIYCRKFSMSTNQKLCYICKCIRIDDIPGHIQIAQAPDRGEPDDKGEINYKYVLQLLEDIGYTGFIGLEYKPRGM